MDRLDKMNSLHIQSTYLLALRLKTLLRNELFSIHGLRITVHVLASEDDLELRMKIVAKLHKIRTLSLGNEAYRRIVAYIEREPLHIERGHGLVIIKSRVNLSLVKLLYLEELTLISVAEIECRSIICTVLEDRKDMVTGIELAEMETAAVFVEPLDVLVEPDVLAAYRRYALRFELDLLDRVLRYEISP